MPTQSTDINGNPYGITYTAIGQTWKVLKGVDVTGTGAGVVSEYVDSTLNNSGSIFGPAGVVFDGGGAASTYVVKNQKKGDIGGDIGVLVADYGGSTFVQNKGDIEASQYAVYLVGYTGSSRVVNKGTVEGLVAGIYSQGGSSNLEIENHKTIEAGQAAIAIDVGSLGSKGPLINNYGDIDALQYAIYVLSNSGTTVKVVNEKGATIDGGAYAIASGEPLDLKNEGKIDGLIFTSANIDKIINKGKIDDAVHLGGGDDVFKNKGKKAQADMIDTAEGNDLVVLGKKADKLLFDSALNAATNVDTVKKFQSGKDKMYLDEDIFSAITPGPLSSSAFHKGSSAADADDRIIYDKASGALYYDPDGTGGMAQTQFAKLDPGSKLKASDFMVGEYSITGI